MFGRRCSATNPSICTYFHFSDVHIHFENKKSSRGRYTHSRVHDGHSHRIFHHTYGHHADFWCDGKLCLRRGKHGDAGVFHCLHMYLSY